MMETILGDNASRFMIAAGAVAIGLLCLVAVLRLMRNKPSSPFVRGGKNRQPRLAVLDAAAVDTRRRLVLVRRDDVEHLIMIGGPTDIVIESRIAPREKARFRPRFRRSRKKRRPAPRLRKSGPRRFLPLSRPSPLSRRKLRPNPCGNRRARVSRRGSPRARSLQCAWSRISSRPPHSARRSRSRSPGLYLRLTFRRYPPSSRRIPISARCVTARFRWSPRLATSAPSRLRRSNR